MPRIRTSLILIGCSALTAAATTASPSTDSSAPRPEGGLAAGGITAARTTPCITPDARATHAATADFNAAVYALNPARPTRGALTAFTFYPQAGNLYSDLFHTNYVDLDPTSGILEWDCGDHTYNGHAGHDTDIRSFEEKRIGVPVFAALDGVVVNLDDGHPDESTTLTNKPANFVILDHSAIEPGLQTWYWHFKTGSVLPTLGQFVHAGEQIGQTASSGYTNGPHLHFEVQSASTPLETMAGPCSPGQSRWAEQWDKRRDHYLRDFGFARGNVASALNPPQPYLRDRAVTFSDTFVTYWLQGHNLPAGSDWRMRFYRPSGQLEFDSGTNAFGFSTADARWYWASFWWNIPAMRAVAGEWTVRVDINGELAVAAPITVLAAADPGFNRPPEAVTGSFDPPAPEADGPVFFRLDTDLVHDDPDYDVVRYRYEWFLDGVLVRDVVSAAHADAVPAVESLGGGSTLMVRVTPNDGDLDGPATTASVNLPNPCPADINGDGFLNNTDINIFVTSFINTAAEGDFNGDGFWNNTDINQFVTAFLAGCG